MNSSNIINSSAASPVNLIQNDFSATVVVVGFMVCVASLWLLLAIFRSGVLQKSKFFYLIGLLAVNELAIGISYIIYNLIYIIMNSFMNYKLVFSGYGCYTYYIPNLLLGLLQQTLPLAI